MRLEVVKRDFGTDQNQLISRQLTENSNLSKSDVIKIFGNEISGFSQDYGDDDSEEDDNYTDPFEKIVAARNSPERVNANPNLLEYTNSSTQNPSLLKTVKIKAIDMDENEPKGMRKNTYYRPPKKVEYNWSKNFGQSMVD